MLAKTTIFLAVMALIAQVTFAQTPACLLAAVNEQPDPSSMEAVCGGKNASAVTSYLCKNCGASTKAALSEFEGACLAAGMNIATEDACSSKAMTSSGSHASTHSGHEHTATATTTGQGSTASPSQTGGDAEGTNAAGEVGVGNGGLSAALLLAAFVAM